MSIGVLTACGTSAVAVEAPTPSDSAQKVCDAFAVVLPDQVLDQPSVATTPDSPYTAAWGDPAIKMRCGVPKPESLTPGAQVFAVNGIDWFPEATPGGVRFVTVGRAATIEVVVPDTYDPQADALIDVNKAVAQTNPLIAKAAP